MKTQGKNSTSGLGEFWDNWIEEDLETQKRVHEFNEERKREAEAKKEKYLEMNKKKLEQMQERYNFSITDEPIRIAIERLEGLKVNEYRMDDYSYQDSFDKVWWSVLHEVDLYEEGEESPLNKTTYKGAKGWLKSFSHLCKERIPAEYMPKLIQED